MSRPRLGFLGVGWIGRHRMQAILETGAVEAVAVADPLSECVADALKLAPDARAVADLDALLAQGVDGLVIATPSGQHAAQSISALDAGVAVFCQKPLGRSAEEVAAVVQAARRADRLLAVDLSYRYTEGARRMRELVHAGELGRVFAADMVFHNAYGPDKPWFYDRAQSGGGCVMDLGVHLVDLALWTLDFPEVTGVTSQLYAGGERLGPAPEQVEDYAVATLELATGVTVRIACSWKLHAGQEAEIGATFHGADGGAALRNENGSFYDFTTTRHRGTAREILSQPPESWGGRAAADWAVRLANGEGFNVEAERLIDSARVLDRIYGR